MAVHDLYSKRQKVLRGEIADVFVYDVLPQRLRVQLVQLLSDGLVSEFSIDDFSKKLQRHVHETLKREYGVFSLSTNPRDGDWAAVSGHLLETTDVESALDIVELGLQVIDRVVRKNNWRSNGFSCSPDDIISEVNLRFRESSVGYEYVAGQIVRIDSQLIHHTVVVPALKFLSDSRFAGANEEFLRAHEHYRKSRTKECLVDCLKAFESTMKTICDLKGWDLKPTDSAKRLIETCLENNLIPTFMQSQLSNLRALLESGVPTVRNRLGGHGQGTEVTDVSSSMARFALNCTAANILLFAESIES